MLRYQRGRGGAHLLLLVARDGFSLGGVRLRVLEHLSCREKEAFGERAKVT